MVKALKTLEGNAVQVRLEALVHRGDREAEIGLQVALVLRVTCLERLSVAGQLLGLVPTETDISEELLLREENCLARWLGEVGVEDNSRMQWDVRPPGEDGGEVGEALVDPELG